MSAQERRHELEAGQAVDGLRLDQAIARLLEDYSRASIRQWIERGLVTVNGRPAKRPRDTVHTGDRLVLTAVIEASADAEPQDVPFRVVHEDPAIVVVDKPAGLVVHPGAGNPDRTLVNGLLAAFPELAELPRAGLVHRIDKLTSGLLVAGRTQASFRRLTRDMAARRIARVYETIVNGVLTGGGTVDQPIGRDPGQRTRMRVRPDGRSAVTHFRVLRRYRAHTHLEVRLETGRTHQIRVHMAWRGHPVVGDARYGARPVLPPAPLPALVAAVRNLDRHALHARRLALTHPESGETVTFEAPLPPALTSLLEALAADDAAHGDTP